MPHPGHFYGLLNEPDPDPPWPPTRLPPSLIAAADEWSRTQAPVDPLVQQQYMRQQAAMGGDPDHASIRATPSRASRIGQYLQHKLPRQAREAVQGGFYGTGAGALRIGQALWPGEQPRMAAMQQFGLSQIPEEGIGAATGVLGSFAPEFTLAGDAADLGRAYGHLTNREDGRWAPEWGGAALSSLAAVPFVGTPAAGFLKARRGVSAATETARVAQEAARAAQEERRIERVAARYSPERPTIGPEVVRDPEIRGLLEVTEAAGIAQEAERVARMNRSELQALLKERGLPATGTNDSLRELADIVAKNPQDWTRAEFDRVRPHISVHQDMKGADLSEGILEEGLTRGMVDPASGLDPGASGWSWGGHLQGGPGGAYLFWPGDIRYKPSSPYIERATPFMHIAPERGEDLYDAIRRVDQSATGGLPEATEAAGVAQEAERIARLTPQQKAARARAEGRALARQDPSIGPAARRSERRFLHHTATPERIAAVEREIERGLAIVPEELAQFRNASPKLRSEMVESYLRGPRPENFADTILAGASGKGWYDISGEGIVESFGDDAPRFTALLAAQSPNKSVEDNLKYALDTWARWNEAGRPAELTRESARGIIASPLPADFDNSILALTADADELLRGKLKLSGPKVDPFNLDLMGNVNRIVQDTHQARGYGVAQSRIGNVGVNLPMNAMVRNAAAIASRRVGVDLTGANAQEMGWGWIRGLTNAAGRDDAVAALRASQVNPNLPMAGKEGMTLAQRVSDNVALGDLMGRPQFNELMLRAGVTPPQPRSTPGLGVEIPPGAVRPSALLDTAARIQANRMGLPLLGVGGLLGASAAARQRDDELDPNSGLLGPPRR